MPFSLEAENLIKPMTDLRRGSIFINYRRDDCLDEAVVIYKSFREALGEEEVVFLDKRSNQLTENWKAKVDKALLKAEVMLSLIGPKWAQSFSDKERNDNAVQCINDWVLYEIETAQRERLDIIPVFLRLPAAIDATVLPRSVLPHLGPILDKQGFFIRPGELESGIADLIDSLKVLMGKAPSAQYRLKLLPRLDPLANLPLPERYEEKIYELDEEGRPLIDQPFLGPTYYSEEMAALFFGREREIRGLYHLVRRSRLVLLHGYSGSGKSSLLHAGLLPRVRALPEWKVFSPLRRNKQRKGLYFQLKQLWDELENLENKRVLITLDQVEEMYTDPIEGGSEIVRLGELLQEIVESGRKIHIILAFRSEYESKLSQEFIPKFRLYRNLEEMYLHPLSEEGIVNAIEGPVRYGYKFKLVVSRHLAGIIARDFVGADFSPHAVLLQVQLVELWKVARKVSEERGTRKVVFSRQLYEENQLKDLEVFVDEGLKELRSKPRWEVPMDKGLGLDVLHSYTTPLGTATSYRNGVFHKKYRHIEGVDTRELLEALKRCYLLVSLSRDNEVTRLAHDSLAPVVRKKYYDSDADGQRAWRIVETKLLEIQQGFGPSFSETDINTIMSGRLGMQQIPTIVLEKMQRDKSRYREQKEKRFELALTTAIENKSNLDFEESLKNLRLALYEDIRSEEIYEEALDLPYFFLETRQVDLLHESLLVIDELGLENSKEWNYLIAIAEEKGDVDRISNQLQQWNPALYQQLQKRFYPSMCLIPGGKFLMGSKEGPANERPVHEVEVDSFLMSEAPVTFWQFGLYCVNVNRGIPRDSKLGRGDQPVIDVSWYDAISYCNWLSTRVGLQKVYEIHGETVKANWKSNGYRLPTEAEWEYAAREGGKDVRFGNGKNIADPLQMNFNGENVFNDRLPYVNKGKAMLQPTEVYRYSPNELGLYDMSGNVFEWCWDIWSGDVNYYKESLGAKNPIGPNHSIEENRMIRGGGWGDEAFRCRTAYRFFFPPSFQMDDLGFRIVRRSSYEIG